MLNINLLTKDGKILLEEKLADMANILVKSEIIIISTKHIMD